MFIEFASVTSALRGLLRDGLADGVELSSRPIDELLSQPVGRSTLNVLLLSASPMRQSTSLPSLHAGSRLQRPAPTYELLYLVTALGTEDLMAEVLLEHVARRFNDIAVLTSPRARLSLATDRAPLLGAEPADWVEHDGRLTITPFDADLPTWLSVWSTLRATWRLSAMYTVAPVALAPSEATPPVLDHMA